jgi:hypothetical protein
LAGDLGKAHPWKTHPWKTHPLACVVGSIGIDVDVYARMLPMSYLGGVVFDYGATFIGGGLIGEYYVAEGTMYGVARAVNKVTGPVYDVGL